MSNLILPYLYYMYKRMQKSNAAYFFWVLCPYGWDRGDAEVLAQVAAATPVKVKHQTINWYNPWKSNTISCNDIHMSIPKYPKTVKGYVRWLEVYCGKKTAGIDQDLFILDSQSVVSTCPRNTRASRLTIPKSINWVLPKPWVTPFCVHSGS